MVSTKQIPSVNILIAHGKSNFTGFSYSKSILLLIQFKLNVINN